MIEGVGGIGRTIATVIIQVPMSHMYVVVDVPFC